MTQFDWTGLAALVAALTGLVTAIGVIMGNKARQEIRVEQDAKLDVIHTTTNAANSALQARSDKAQDDLTQNLADQAVAADKRAEDSKN